MKLLNLKTLRGPNYWSISWRKITEATIDIEQLEEMPTNKIDGFAERLTAAIPSLYSHHCSEGHEGGFLKRVKEGTWMAHVIEHIALELQFLAGMDCSFGHTRSSAQKGVYYVAFSHEIPDAGRYAIKAAMNIAQHLIDNTPYDIAEDVAELEFIRSTQSLGISTAAILAEAKKRDIPYRKLSAGPMYVLGHGVNQKRISASIACSTSGLGIDVACDKELTKRLLQNAYIPVPQGEVVSSPEGMLECITQMGYPVVIKPIDGNHGNGVTVNVQNENDAYIAFSKAANISKQVIVERFIQGSDYRFLVVNNKFVAAAKRTPAMVTGNGRSTIKELVEELNKDPKRGAGHAKALTFVEIDAMTEKVLTQKGLTIESIPYLGEMIFLKDTANLSTGGTSIDVTEKVHPQNIQLVERISRIVNLNICGIDIVAKDVNKPLTAENGCIIEVNACPGLRMHLNPSEGKSRNVAEPIVSMLFPNENRSRIPIIAVTGTNGKTTTTRLIAHIAKTAGQSVGYTTTDGIYINDEVVCHADCTGENSTEIVLTDPIVDFAVLECARGGILRTGLGFDACDTSIVTNVAEDHLGLDGIDSLRDMAKIKSVVPETTKRDGYAILNAEDDEVFFMGDRLKCNIALFALDPNNERLLRHCKRGGLAATIEEGQVVIRKGDWTTVICPMADIPLTFSGKNECMVKNVLPAVLASVIHRFDVKVIQKALYSFHPSPANTPGRFNVFKFKEHEVMVDYAHNPHALIELRKFVQNIEATHKVGIITAPGDRRDEDIVNTGVNAAKIFDEIIIRLDEDLRGRTEEELTGLLKKGIQSVRPFLPITIIASEGEAIIHALNTSKAGTFITTLTEKVWEAITLVESLQKNEEENKVLKLKTFPKAGTLLQLKNAI